MSGHAHHFLSRLDRLARPHVELALSLYNDVQLLRFVLLEAGVPSEVERVALCLGSPELGPHLVVTRDGRFVTALGEGMRPFDVTVVSRETLERLGRRVGALRERLRASESLRMNEGHSGALLRKISAAGPRFTREDYLAIAGLHPFLAQTFLEGMLDSAEACLRVSKELHRDRRMRPKLREEWLRLGWDAFWALNHFTVLAGTDWGWDPLKGIDSASPDVQRTFLHWTHVRLGCFSSFARGLWFAGRCGASSYDVLVDRYIGAQTMTRVVATGVGLLAIACRNPERLPEVREVLGRHEAEPLDEREDRIVRAVKERLSVSLSCDVATQQRNARDLLLDLAAAVPGVGSEQPFSKDDEAMAWCALTQSPFDLHNDMLQLAAAIDLAPGLALLEPEDFFVPRALQDAAPPRWSPKRAEEVFAPLCRYLHVPEPARASPTPGRNEPCSCGSGEKFKRCCLNKPR